MTVCWEEGQFTNYGTAKGQLEAGIEYWETWLVNNNITSEITFRTGTSSNPCSLSTDRVVVSVDNNLPSSVPGEASASGYFAMNPSFLAAASQSLMNWVGAHEMGHVLGFGLHSNQNCASSTVMVATYPGSFSLGGALCADLFGLTDLYHYDNAYPDEEHEPADGTDPFYEDCYIIWNVTVAFWYDSNGNYHEEIIWWDYGGWTCTPPI